MLPQSSKTKSAHTRLQIACVLLGIIASIGVGCQSSPAPTKPISQEQIPLPSYVSSTPAVQPIFLDAFMDATRLKRAQQTSWTPSLSTRDCSQIKAALINHHVLASDVMLNVVRELKRCRPNQKNFIILAPDHFVQGGNGFLTGTRSFQYKTTSIKINETQVNDLLANVPYVQQKNDTIAIEHGINAPVAMLSTMFDDLQITPILISVTLTNERVQPLADWLTLQMQQGSFVLVSSDMSHYLNKNIALENDQESQQALQKNQSTFFLKTRDDHACNAKGIAILQLAIPKATWLETSHAISSDYGGSTRETTSYITGFWK